MERGKVSLTIADHSTGPIEIDCPKCGRQGRYRKATLIEKHGSDIVMLNLLALIAGDREVRVRLSNQGCGAIYPSLGSCPKA